MEGIFFPGWGISFTKVLRDFTIFGLSIKFYAIIITLGFIFATIISRREARLSNQNPEDYLDFVLAMVIPVIVGARLYYVIFNHENFFGNGKTVGQTIWAIINLRSGGLAVYGGLIAGTITAIIFAKKKKMTMPLMWDTVSMGVLFGQMLGRWGNFFNRECFGGYSNGFFRMAIPYDYFEVQGSAQYYINSGVITQEMLDNMEIVNGIHCITVHPTFLYEGLLNLLVIIFILIYRRHKKFDGEVGLIYMMGYGICRFIVEAMRTDSLMIGSFKISQVVALVCIVLAAVLLIYNRKRIADGHEPKLHPIVKPEPEKR